MSGAGTDQRLRGLSELMDQSQLTRFLSEFWERAPFHLLAASNPQLAVLMERELSLTTVDELLTVAYPAYPRPNNSVLVVEDSHLIHGEQYLKNPSAPAAWVLPDAVLAQYRQGRTIVLNSIQRYLPYFHTLCTLLRPLVSVANANIYITPPASVGFGAHWDAHDVILVQLSGTKTWKLTPSNDALATRESTDKDLQAAGLPTHVIDIEAGDLLYMPRGTFHDGSTTDTHSVHLTIGLIPYTRAHLLRDTISALEHTTPSLRASAFTPTGHPAAQHTDDFTTQLPPWLQELCNAAYATIPSIPRSEPDPQSSRGQLLNLLLTEKRHTSHPGPTAR